jgi:hypothetical protein
MNTYEKPNLIGAGFRLTSSRDWTKYLFVPVLYESYDNNKLFKIDIIIFIIVVGFEVFTAVTMKNAVFWDVTPCGSCKNRRFGGTWLLLHQGDKNR